jgi:hypothetical protein
VCKTNWVEWIVMAKFLMNQDGVLAGDERRRREIQQVPADKSAGNGSRCPARVQEVAAKLLRAMAEPSGGRER